MADNDPRKFLIKCEDKKGLGRGRVIDLITKTSELDINNKLVNGLKTLTKTYNVASNLPIIGDGVKEVAGATQLPVPLGSMVERFNPGVANQAQSTMKQIGQKLKQRNFKLSDVPQAAADLGGFAKLANRIFTPKEGKGADTASVCGISPYAVDLVNLGVKQKFLFVAEFKFSNPAGSRYSFNDNGFAMFIKQFDRPNIQYDYEDVNIYNYRTKVLKKTTYEPQNMIFYDDASNRVMHFLNHYLSSTSPLYNYRGISPETESMEFNSTETEELMGPGPTQQVSTGIKKYASSSGPISDLVAGPLTVISEINVYHVFNKGTKMNKYNFVRPKIHQIQMDDLSMEVSDANLITLNFSYDALHIDLDQSLEKLKSQDRDGKYKLRYVGEEGSDKNIQEKTTTYTPDATPKPKGLLGF